MTGLDIDHLVEYAAHVTIDTRTGERVAYIIRDAGDGQWAWIADKEFGPFDTWFEIAMWLTRMLALDNAAR